MTFYMVVSVYRLVQIGNSKTQLQNGQLEPSLTNQSAKPTDQKKVFFTS